MGYISKKVAAYGQFVLVYFNSELTLDTFELFNPVLNMDRG